MKMPKYIVNTTITKTQYVDFQFEVEAESQKDANDYVKELGFEESLNTFKVVNENIYNDEFNEEWFEVL